MMIPIQCKKCGYTLAVNATNCGACGYNQPSPSVSEQKECPNGIIHSNGCMCPDLSDIVCKCHCHHIDDCECDCFGTGDTQKECPHCSPQPLQDKEEDWESEIDYLFSRGGTNPPYTNAHVQYSDSKYPNQITKDIVKAFIRKEKQRTAEDCIKEMDSVYKADYGHITRDYNRTDNFRDDVRDAIKSKYLKNK